MQETENDILKRVRKIIQLDVDVCIFFLFMA